MLRKLQPQLETLGRRQAMTESAKAAVRYFEQLPPELRDHATVRAHAVALRYQARAQGLAGFRVALTEDGGEQAAVRSGELWRQVAEADPTDDEAAAEALIFGRSRKLRDPALTREEGLAMLWKDQARAFELEKRFPESPWVQLAIVRLTRGLLVELGGTGDHAKDIAAGLVAVGRMERVVAAHPEDRNWSIELVSTLFCLSMAYSRAGRWDECDRQLERGLAVAEALLAEDPGNIQYLNTASGVSYMRAVGRRPENKREERIGIARAHTQRLLMLEPGDRDYLFREAVLLEQLAQVRLLERRLPEAQQLLESALAHLESIENHLTIEGDAIGQGLTLAGVAAARREDHAAARRWIERMRQAMAEGVAKPKAWGPGRLASEEWEWRVFWRHNEIAVVATMEDWTQLEQLAREVLAELGDAADRSRRRVNTQAVLGMALLKQGRREEGLPLLEEAVPKLQANMPAPAAMGSCPSGVFDAVELLAEALVQDGRRAQATELLEWSFARRDAWVRFGALLESKVAAARSAWLLAQALDSADPAAAARREELLARAAELLDDPAVAPRLTEEERHLRDQIGSLGVATLLSLGGFSQDFALRNP